VEIITEQKSSRTIVQRVDRVAHRHVAGAPVESP